MAAFSVILVSAFGCSTGYSYLAFFPLFTMGACAAIYLAYLKVKKSDAKDKEAEKAGHVNELPGNAKLM